MKPNLKKYDPQIYPRKLWISTIDDAQYLANTFTFYSTTDLKKERDNTSKELIKEAEEGSGLVAAVYPVSNNKTLEIGVLLVIFDLEEFDTSYISHESVHVADYYYKALSMYSDDFESNEQYAYLVGWVAGKISEYLIDLNNGK